VLLKEGHSYSVDWWSLGVLIYEMLFSCPPFYQKDQKEMFQSIINKEVDFPKNTPVSPECRSLLRSLLHKYPEKRLGHHSSEDIRNHAWFKEIEWEKLMNMEVSDGRFR
jgi:serine/threonine protein kinase